MHNVVVGLTYLAMLMSPCVVAQWGHLLSWRTLRLISMTRKQRVEARLADEQLDLQLELLLSAESSFGITNIPLPFAMNSSLEAARARQFAIASDSPSFADGQRRVAARLAQIAAQHRSVVVAEEMDAAIPVTVPEYAIAKPAAQIQRPVVAIPEYVSERPAAIPQMYEVLSHTFETTDMGLAWNSTTQYSVLTLQPQRPLNHEAAVDENDSQTAEHQRKSGDLSKAA